MKNEWQKIVEHIENVKTVTEKRKKPKTFFMKIVNKKCFWFLFSTLLMLVITGGVIAKSPFGVENNIYIWMFSVLILFWMNLKVIMIFYNQTIPDKERRVKIMQRIQEVMELEGNHSLMNEITTNMDDLPHWWWEDLALMSREYKIKKRNEGKMKELEKWKNNEKEGGVLSELENETKIDLSINISKKSLVKNKGE